MKDSMIEVMVSMMPLMKPFMWFGVGIAVLGILLLVVQLLFKTNANTAIVWATRVVFSVSIFFILAQAAGHYLSMPPAVNFGDSSNFEFILVSFWQISLVFFVVALFLKLIGGSNRRQAS